MESIIVSVVAGLFSLIGIWYQNYLSKKSSINSSPTPTTIKDAIVDKTNKLKKPKNESRIALRVFFTFIIAILPWVLFQILLPFLTYERFGDETGRQRTMFAFYSIWLAITAIALISGWKRKTILEKIILIVSALFLMIMIYPLSLKD